MAPSAATVSTMRSRKRSSAAVTGPVTARSAPVPNGDSLLFDLALPLRQWPGRAR